MSSPRINLTCESEAQRDTWEKAAKKERIPITVWMRKYLDEAAEKQLGIKGHKHD
ncbi:hypothetical protein [Thalassoglobus polymorphus]|uniref:Uncharacterized protein n=1 Tax=Thalassoglobus polymorphus TaxID=2527994 RepID=A0A517QH37_9PLAN|nr:hypothetical protein [Thalassoglobus polymorphus]QDT30944.1 hypothetical protein Mal48_01730 [Thalassoglobus polymorphus]QDT30988.1 hypothetical protein Mal48_02170 [Thalassoglobus polymorphus]